jgi:hypothetical protein
MQKRARRPHGINSRKISVSVSEDDLKVLSARAKRLHRGNISATVHEMVATLKREEAADEVLGMLGGDQVTEEEMQAVRDEIATAGAARQKPRKRRTAA